jgi:hypothetical protein
VSKNIRGGERLFVGGGYFCERHVNSACNFTASPASLAKRATPPLFSKPDALPKIILLLRAWPVLQSRMISPLESSAPLHQPTSAICRAFHKTSSASELTPDYAVALARA